LAFFQQQRRFYYKIIIYFAMTDKKQQSANDRNDISRESILKVSKEVAIKFIEMGRVTPATFDDTFRKIFETVKDTVKKR